MATIAASSAPAPSTPSAAVNGSAPQNQTFLHNAETINESDTVIIYVDPDNILSVVVKRGVTCNMKNGALRHEFLIGKRYGTRLMATAGPIFALRPQPTLWTRALKRHTQIIYTQEISMIISLLDLRPGDVVCESGTGSGSLTHALAAVVGANGHVYTHDIEEPQVNKMRAEAAEHGLTGCVTATLRNVCDAGFVVERPCHAVFLDLPAPWLAVPHAIATFDRGAICRLVSFSPCIEQTQRLCEALTEAGAYGIRTYELVGTTYRSEHSRLSTLEELEVRRPERRGVRRNIRNEPTNGGDDSEPRNADDADAKSALAKGGSDVTASGDGDVAASGVLGADAKSALAKGDSDATANGVLIPSPYQQPSHAGYLTAAIFYPPR